MSTWELFEKPTSSSSARNHLSQTELEREELKRQSQLLIEETKRTFRELTTTLSREQIRLTDIEENRKRLLNQMLDLKADIEKEKEAIRLELQNTANENENGLDPWYGLDEEEFERKQKLAVNSSSSLGNRTPKHIEPCRSSIEITKEIVERLEGLARLSSSHDGFLIEKFP